MAGHDTPAPQVQPPSSSRHGLSGWFSQTHPMPSQRVRFGRFFIAKTATLISAETSSGPAAAHEVLEQEIVKTNSLPSQGAVCLRSLN